MDVATGRSHHPTTGSSQHYRTELKHERPPKFQISSEADVRNAHEKSLFWRQLRHDGSSATSALRQLVAEEAVGLCKVHPEHTLSVRNDSVNLVANPNKFVDAASQLLDDHERYSKLDEKNLFNTWTKVLSLVTIYENNN